MIRQDVLEKVCTKSDHAWRLNGVQDGPTPWVSFLCGQCWVVGYVNQEWFD